MSDEVRVEIWNGAQLRSRMSAAMAVYAAAMAYSPLVGEQRGGFAASHSRYADFECRAAVIGPTDGEGSYRGVSGIDSTIVGIAYGYGSRPGQWWHDAVRRAVPHHLAQEWMYDAFELSELHVLPAYQGGGIGQRLLESLVAPVAHETVLLSTPEGPTRAFRLYRRLGFIDLARNYMFAGDGRPFAVLGARLPLVASDPSTGARPSTGSESQDARLSAHGEGAGPDQSARRV
jgi:ribosomal protein S18 acetylase RimI-like enzyme